MFYCLSCLVLFLFSFQAHANSPMIDFEKANTFYQKNAMEKAIQAYESLIREGVESAEIYYNLGNAYYKTNNNASAILNYERAKRLKPQDDDILFNLRMANLKVLDKVEAVPTLFYENWWNQMVNYLNFDQWAMAGVTFLWIVFILILWFILTASRSLKQLTFYFALIFFLSGIMTIYIADCQFKIFKDRNEAVVFVPSVYIKSAPADKSTDLFILHEGSKVQIMDHVGPWKKIRLQNGNVGWVKENNIQII
jgi:tetratricopeptide (TPR) repeat protein